MTLHPDESVHLHIAVALINMFLIFTVPIHVQQDLRHSNIFKETVDFHVQHGAISDLLLPTVF